MSRLDVGAGSMRPLLRRLLLPAIFVGALFAVVVFRRPAPERPEEVTFAGPTMGTTFSVKVVTGAPLGDDARRRLSAAIEETLEAVDRSMSTWREDSELSRFNLSGTEPFAASPALREVVTAALEVHRRSGGAFDVTVGPLVEAWGFGRRDIAAFPTDEAIAALLPEVGSQHLSVEEAGFLRKAIPGLACDLSAIAKGYAVDRVAAAVEAGGYSSFLVEIGGEVVARGRNARGEPWRLGIESPDPDDPSLRAVVALDGVALATSGDYRNFQLDDGQRISHILDPRTGRPTLHDLASVSVVAPTCMAADAWATALSVLGAEEGREVAEREGLAVLFLSRQPDGTLLETRTSTWKDVAIPIE